MTREEEKLHQSHLYSNERCNSIDLPDWEEVEWAFQSGMDYADAHPVHYDGKAYLYVLHKGVEQGKRGMLEDNIKWLKAHINDYLVQGRDIDLMFDDLRKAMEE